MKAIKVKSCRECNNKREFPSADVWWCRNDRLTDIDTIHPNCPLSDYPDHSGEANKTIDPSESIEMFVARDGSILDHQIYLYDSEPIRCKDHFICGKDKDFNIELAFNSFPSVTFKNSPQRVRLTLIEE